MATQSVSASLTAKENNRNIALAIQDNKARNKLISSKFYTSFLFTILPSPSRSAMKEYPRGFCFAFLFFVFLPFNELTWDNTTGRSQISVYTWYGWNTRLEAFPIADNRESLLSKQAKGGYMVMILKSFLASVLSCLCVQQRGMILKQECRRRRAHGWCAGTRQKVTTKSGII